MADENFATERQQMLQIIAVHTHLAGEALGRARLDARVFEAMGKVPRHEFVPLEVRAYAYLDSPLPIGFDKTISQPFIAALMTDLLELQPDDVVLEVGTGLGYHAAVLSQLAARIYSVEIVEELSETATRNLKRMGYGNIELRVGDGSRGWPEHAPFDKIMVAAGVELIPPMLLQQLKPGGRMVVPAGTADAQQLMLVEKNAAGKTSMQALLPVRFGLLEEYH